MSSKETVNETVSGRADVAAAIVLIAFAGFTYYAARNLGSLQGYTFGAGTAPRLFAVGLAAMAGLVLLRGLRTIGMASNIIYSYRSILHTIAAALAFCFLVQPGGIIVASFVSVMISSTSARPPRWTESTILGLVLTAFCVVLFRYALGLPLPLWPTF